MTYNGERILKARHVNGIDNVPLTNNELQQILDITIINIDRSLSKVDLKGSLYANTDANIISNIS